MPAPFLFLRWIEAEHSYIRHTAGREASFVRQCSMRPSPRCSCIDGRHSVAGTVVGGLACNAALMMLMAIVPSGAITCSYTVQVLDNWCWLFGTSSSVRPRILIPQLFLCNSTPHSYLIQMEMLVRFAPSLRLVHLPN